MAKFIAIWRQRAGCDYTIGCGIQIIEFEAEDLDAAREAQIKDLVDSGDETVGSMRSIQIFQLAGPNCRIDDAHWGHAYKAKREAERQAEQDRKDRAEYDRLSKKFGKKP